MPRPDPGAAPDATSSSLATANRAIALARAGKVAEGLAAYRQGITALRGEGVPVFLHLALLREAGAEVVAAFRRVALQAGGDVSRAYAVRGVPVATALAEYRALFADGVANARMLANYARLLSLAGCGDELRALMDLDRLLAIRTIADPAPDGGGRPFHEALKEWFRANRDKAEQLSQRLAAVGTLRYGDLGAFDDALIHALRDLMTRQVREYIAAVAGTPGEHPMRTWVPKDFTLEMFAHYSDGTGYHLPHIHSRGWITGVYYVDCDFGPDARPEEGALHLCPGLDGDPACPGWPERCIPVRPGMLVLFPSYYTHFTRPLGRPCHRLVLPFDVADTRAPAGGIAEAA